MARVVRAGYVVYGATTLAGVSGGLGGPGDRAVFSVLRALADVVLVGADGRVGRDQEGVVPQPDERAGAWRHRCEVTASSMASLPSACPSITPTSSRSATRSRATAVIPEATRRGIGAVSAWTLVLVKRL